MSKENKYGGLVESGIISEEDLNSTILMANNENREIEYIFLNEFYIIQFYLQLIKNRSQFFDQFVQHFLLFELLL